LAPTLLVGDRRGVREQNLEIMFKSARIKFLRDVKGYNEEYNIKK
jgi:hypothetical protein